MFRKGNHLLCLFLVIMAVTRFTVSAQASGPNGDENSEKNYYVGAIEDQVSVRDSLFFWQEKIRLHTDKSNFLPGEVLFFRADIFTGPEQLRVSASEVLKVEFLNEKGELLLSQFHRIENGNSVGSLEIPKKLNEGVYYLRAYTRWMLNYGPELIATKQIEIEERRSKTKSLAEGLFLRPESGSLIDQLPTQVMAYHKDISLHKAPIVNSKGEIITRNIEFQKGIGRFLFTPVKGETYYIIVEEDLLIPLPQVQETGYTIQLNNLNSDKALINIEASAQLMDRPVFLKGVRNGISFFKSEVVFQGGPSEKIEIPKTELPEGILELRLEDDSGRVWARRPWKINKNELYIEVERQRDASGDEVFKFQVYDEMGKPVETELSVSLLEEINSDLIPGSVRRGTEGEAELRNQRFIEDLLLLTGQYTGEEINVVPSRVPDEILYGFQKGLEFYGQAYDLNNTLLENTEIQMLITAGEEVFAIETKTNSDGMFKITGMQIEGEAHIIFRTAGEETDEKLVKVVPYEYEIPPLKLPGEVLTYSEKEVGSDAERPQRSVREFDSEIKSEKPIELEEVTLVATRELHKTSVSRYDLRATRVIEQDIERPKTLPQLFLNIPGVQVVGLGTLSPSIFIPRAARLGPLLWVIDGFPLNQTTRFVDVINLVSYIDVERIELLLGAEASVYGSRAAGGVIQIFTRSGSDIEYLARKDAEVLYQGFHESVSFEEYSSNRKRKRSAEGIAKTLYWEPQLATDSTGKAEIRLSGTAIDSPMRVVVKAVTENGLKGDTIIFF
ncbi:TonB-dependent receptor [Muriicola sp. SD30]|uniref:TonB-dependent receptor n=1 Tax=Muriicola sp. SD30 TaxID=3240936 RepID=UPI00350E8EBA